MCGGISVGGSAGEETPANLPPPRTIVRVSNSGMTVATTGNATDFGDRNGGCNGVEASRNPEQLCLFQSPKPDF